MRISVQEVTSHRNGVCGTGFYVVTFREGRRRMVAIRFDHDTPEADANRIAVFDAALLGEGVIAFGENSWRGDHYVEAIDAAIVAYEVARTPVGDLAPHH